MPIRDGQPALLQASKVAFMRFDFNRG